ncbi:hypothetical protein [Phenylobacterium sp.]|uniref:hypothetical protein n=1 Tax=Phenylobacterium sp. TaxID=1871053 RepID=UPI00289CC195|nr:hypothetical protein [Phenylobacterium sp.]
MEAPIGEFEHIMPTHVPSPVVIRSARAHGVWHVTCDDVFFGDYLSQDAARSAASKAAKDIEEQGRAAEIVFGPRSP